MWFWIIDDNRRLNHNVEVHTDEGLIATDELGGSKPLEGGTELGRVNSKLLVGDADC